MQLFNKLDVNGDGKLTAEELKNGYVKLLGIEEQEAEMKVLSILQQVDIDHNNHIDYSEFVMACMKKDDMLNEG